MIFITFTQLNDSIIITADNKKVVFKENGEIQFDTEQTTRIHSWDKGIITGTGEGYIIKRSSEILNTLADSDIHKLPHI